MTTLDFLKDMREDTPVEWKELDEAIEKLEGIENYLKAQMDNERRDFRDRCIFREILEHIGGSND